MFESKESGVNYTEFMMKYCDGKMYLYVTFQQSFYFFWPYIYIFPLVRIVTIEDFNKEEMDSVMTNVRVGHTAKNLQENQKYMLEFA